MMMVKLYLHVHLVGRSDDGSLKVVHDNRRGVTCWVAMWGTDAMSCLPDSALRDGGTP